MISCVRPQWPTAPRNLPPRVQSPTPQPPPCRPGPLSALWAACRRSCSLPACRSVRTWWTSASPLRTRGQDGPVSFIRCNNEECKIILRKLLIRFRSESERTETAIQTDLPPQRTAADTTRSLGPTTLLRDTVIRAEETRGRKESPKTAVLLALSRPSRPISRSQSQVTVAGEAKRKQVMWKAH